MNEYIDSNLNLKQTEMDELDKYLEDTLNNDSDSDIEMDPNTIIVHVRNPNPNQTRKKQYNGY